MKINKRQILILTTLFVFGILSFNTNAQMLTTVVAVTGNIFDAVTKEPQTVFVIVLDEQGNKVTATRSNAYENGYYYVTGLKPGNKYTVRLKKAKYFLENYDIFIANSDKYEEISKDFLIKPLYVGAKIPFQVPPFELNKTKLRFGAEEFLKDITNTLLNNLEVNVEIHCYPDAVGNKTDNLALTTERCKSLLNFFVASGIANTRLNIKPHDSVDPDNPPPTKTKAKGKRYIGTSYIIVQEIK
jgi:outer membrane protein OmpA-like peptidoglycan-associated protein